MASAPIAALLAKRRAEAEALAPEATDEAPEGSPEGEVAVHTERGGSGGHQGA